MSAACSCDAAATPPPNLFDPLSRRARFARLARSEAVRLAGEILVRALNVITMDPASRVADHRVTDDRRFLLALSVAEPLSLRSRSARPGRFAEVERRVVATARERGLAGLARRSLEAASLIACAVAASAAEAGDDASRAFDAAIDAEVLATSL